MMIAGNGCSAATIAGFLHLFGGHQENRDSDRITRRPEDYRLRQACRESRQESFGATLSNLHCGIQIRLQGSRKLLKEKKFWLRGMQVLRMK
jgi:hypothetical protein